MTYKNHTVFSLLLFVGLLTMIEACAMTLLKKYSIEKNVCYFLPVFILYGIMAPLLIVKNLEYEGIATLNIIWNIMSTFIVLFIGIIIFKENVSHLHLISLLLSILAIISFYYASAATVNNS